MGPPRGRLTSKTSAGGLSKAMAAEMANVGYWSVSAEAADLAPVLLRAALAAAPQLAHRGTALGIMPELMPLVRVRTRLLQRPP
eukprot:86583-Chlamydomonas_euryale.AAC.1